MNLRTKLAWRVALSPGLWFRLYPIDKEFDAWLWEALEMGAKPEPCYHSTEPCPEYLSKFEVFILGVKIWVSNEPYADVALNDVGSYGASKRSASRVTALRLRRMLQAKSPSTSLPDPFYEMYGKELGLDTPPPPAP